LLLTLSSGVTGFTTIHTGSARQALIRLRFVCQLADAPGGLPLGALNTLVSESIDVVVHCTRTAKGPRVTDVVMVEDLQGGLDATQFTVTEVFRRPEPDQPLAWTGDVPVRAARALADAGHDMPRLLDDGSSHNPSHRRDISRREEQALMYQHTHVTRSNVGIVSP
jgi:pilus assembly protein CpaF